jgi:ankyrin repeat protein
LMLVATGRVPGECNVQVPLINLLCDYGANPDIAILAAALHGVLAAVDALIARGARVDLPIAAALNRVEEVRTLLRSANGVERHLALALASQMGHIEIVRLLLDAGEDPNRYNPPGAHAHSTPLHHAALYGHEDVVRLLIERGASADTRDLLWRGTPAGWAQHESRPELEAYLRALETNQESKDGG